MSLRGTVRLTTSQDRST